MFGVFFWGEWRKGAGGFLCVGFVLLAFSFCDVVWVFFFFLLLLNALLLASPKSRLLESYERDHLERGRRVKRENPPKTVCSQRLYILYCLQAGLEAHREIVAVISYPPPKHPSTLHSVQSLMRCLHPLSCQGTQACPMPSSLPLLHG